MFALINWSMRIIPLFARIAIRNLQLSKRLLVLPLLLTHCCLVHRCVPKLITITYTIYIRMCASTNFSFLCAFVLCLAGGRRCLNFCCFRSLFLIFLLSWWWILRRKSLPCCRRHRRRYKLFFIWPPRKEVRKTPKKLNNSRVAELKGRKVEVEKKRDLRFHQNNNNNGAEWFSLCKKSHMDSS